MYVCLLAKRDAAFKWKDAISGFPVSADSAEALIRGGRKINHHLIAHFLSKMSAKNYQNPFVYVKVIAKRSSDNILGHSVDARCSGSCGQIASFFLRSSHRSAADRISYRSHSVLCVSKVVTVTEAVACRSSNCTETLFSRLRQKSQTS